MAHTTKSSDNLKIIIKEAKWRFIEKALSSTKLKEIWHIIYRIIKPNPKPVRLNVIHLNKHFVSTALHSEPLALQKRIAKTTYSALLIPLRQKARRKYHPRYTWPNPKKS